MLNPSVISTTTALIAAEFLRSTLKLCAGCFREAEKCNCLCHQLHGEHPPLNRRRLC